MTTKLRLFRVTVQGADDKGVLDDDAPKLLEVAVEVAQGDDENPVSLQQQLREALEAARPQAKGSY